MLARLAADGVLVLHLAFVVFVMTGALLAFRVRWIVFAHLPAVVWAIVVEATGRFCPLTLLENALRIRAGASGYHESFIEHYVVRLLYPEGLTSGMQLALATLVLVVNVVLYGIILLQRPRRAAASHA
jgi:hypothetical protein